MTVVLPVEVLAPASASVPAPLLLTEFATPPMAPATTRSTPPGALPAATWIGKVPERMAIPSLMSEGVELARVVTPNPFAESKL